MGVDPYIMSFHLFVFGRMISAPTIGWWGLLTEKFGSNACILLRNMV